MSVSDVGVTSPLNKTNKSQAGSRKNRAEPKYAPLYHAVAARSHNWGGDGTLIAPDSVRVLLPYTATLLPTTTLGSLYTYQFRGNSVFDPDYTSAGSQPNGFDLWAGFYNSFVVLSSRIEVELICAAGYSAQTVVVPSYSASALSSVADASGARYAVSKLSTGGGNVQCIKLSTQMSTSQMFGIAERAVVDDDLYSAVVTTNPAAAQTWYWTVYHQNVSNTTTLSSCIRVRLLFDVKFFDPSQYNLSAKRKQGSSAEIPQAQPALESSSLGQSNTPCGAAAACVCSAARPRSSG